MHAFFLGGERRFVAKLGYSNVDWWFMALVFKGGNDTE